MPKRNVPQFRQRSSKCATYRRYPKLILISIILSSLSSPTRVLLPKSVQDFAAGDLNTTPPQRSLIALPAPSPPILRRFLSIFPSSIPLPHTELRDPRHARQEHTSNSHPRQNQVFLSLICVHTNIVPVLIDQMRRFCLNDRNDDGSNEQRDEADGCETPVPEGYEAGSV